MDGLLQVEIRTRGELRAWLMDNHTQAQGIWVVTYKRAAGGIVAWNDIVEEALCFGWIDSLPRKLDERRTMLRLTPRSPKSKWSAKNKLHVEALERNGQMHTAGKSVVEAARASGTWDALNALSLLKIPADLEQALEDRPGARMHWDSFPPSTRRGVLEWIEGAKKPETRRVRVEETADLAARGLRANQWSPKL
jgi:uncharacterized protein YdeI (YjbR/CyaY-like superfamily)